MQRRLPYIGVLCCLPLLVQPQLVQAGSAVTVPVAARDTAAQAKADAQVVFLVGDLFDFTHGSDHSFPVVACGRRRKGVPRRVWTVSAASAVFYLPRIT